MRVAIWIQGGIGGGNFSQGYPPLLHFLMGVSENAGITVYSILPPNADFNEDRFALRTINRRIKNSKIRTLLLVLLFFKDHLQRRFDIIHAFWVYPAGTVAVLLGKILGRPSVVTVQGGEAAAVTEINYGNMLRPWLKKITLWTCEKATVLNSISRFLLDELSRHGLRRNDGVVIPFGPDVSRFPFKSRHVSFPLRVIHVANLTEVKDQNTILECVKILSNSVKINLQIIGADYLNGALQRKCVKLGIDSNVEFVGSVQQSALPPFYENAQIMVHTSLHEGQSGVIMEAMASGVVVCATPVGIVYDLGGKFFKVINFKDPVNLSSAILELVGNADEYNRLSKQSFDFVSTHDAAWTQREFLNLYQATIEKTG
jgi:glycosyltransferase involved in cell wall biosynthesis